MAQNDDRTKELFQEEIAYRVRFLKRFLGPDRLKRAQARIDREMSHHGECYAFWLKQRNPWIFALRQFDQLTLGGLLAVDRYPLPIQLLAADGKMLYELSKSMPEALRSKYATDLMLDSFPDFQHELNMAWHYQRRGMRIFWTHPGNERGPEFLACQPNGKIEFNVECKRLGSDFSSKVKSPQVIELCDWAYKALIERSQWGKVTIELSSGFVPGSVNARSSFSILKAGLDKGMEVVQINPDIVAHMEVATRGNRTYSRDELDAFLMARDPDDFVFVHASRRGQGYADAIIITVRGPQKSPQQLRDSIYKILKEKAKHQLPMDRAGVLIIKAEGVTDTSAFDESPGLQSILERLFSAPQLASVGFVLDRQLREFQDTINTDASMVMFRNPNCAFPLARDFRHA